MNRRVKQSAPIKMPATIKMPVNAHGITEDDFLEAVMCGRVLDIKGYASKGFKWNRALTLSNGDMNHPLHFAIRELQVDVVHALLELGADPGLVLETPGCSQLSPLQYARSLIVDDDDAASRSDNFDVGRIVSILEKHIRTVGQDDIPISAKIEAINKRIAEAEDVGPKLKKLRRTNKYYYGLINKQLEVIEVKMNTLREKKKNLLKIQSLKERAERNLEAKLMTESERSYQRHLLETFEKKKERAAAMAKDLGQDLECVVCYSVPAGHIYSCAVCVNLMCDACVDKLKSCPSCRQNFKKKKYIRNIALEKIAQKLRV